MSGVFPHTLICPCGGDAPARLRTLDEGDRFRVGACRACGATLVEAIARAPSVATDFEFALGSPSAAEALAGVPSPTCAASRSRLAASFGEAAR